MAKTNAPTAQQIGEAVLLLASLFGGAAVVSPPAGAATPPKDEPKTTSSDASATTAAESTGAEEGPVKGNSQGLDVAAFTKLGLEFANSNKPTSGNQLKEILKSFGQERLGAINPKDYDALLEKIEEAKLS